ncbi:rhamnulokinase [Paenibacillus sp. 598K]|uniref:rhamnulokinase n=1 Tax=Paenibacillus sp. 598K TaxID=1117987 RepID=UPI000FFA4EBE|nr:rhamnulokinase family protein [Paenibacillus sp. 598K]GBF72998.1 rhamnulokinase [Paenibacillus sp. 598K]
MGNRSLAMLAADYGASSGRVMLGRFDGRRLALSEIHRFANEPVQLGETLHWDFLRLFHELKTGIRAFGRESGEAPASIAVDTWGVDFGLVDAKGRLVGHPVHYRDARTDGVMPELFAQYPEHELFATTGIQPLQFNTIFQLYAMREEWDARFARGEAQLLFMPDLLRYYLTGERSAEYTIASTSGLLDPQRRDWSSEVLTRTGLPRQLFPELVEPGTVCGGLTEAVAEELRLPRVPVVATASHDTASAVAAVPTQHEQAVFISCGTWSLMGVETERPIMTEQARDWSFTNEAGAFGKIRLLKNIMGLWLLQECKRQWELEGEPIGYAEMVELARSVPRSDSYIDPEDAGFLAPGGMPQRIQSYCARTGQRSPQSKAELIRCVLESLALKFRQTLGEIEQLLGYRAPQLYMVGGGIQNTLLCQLTADCAGLPVIAGPVEATAAGNLLLQAHALGEIGSLREIRQIVADSFAPTVYEPRSSEQWDDAYGRFLRISRAAAEGQ